MINTKWLLGPAIVALLAAFIVPKLGCRYYQGPLTACKSNLKNIGTAMEMYADDHDGHYPRNLAQLTPDYLRSLPECYAAKRNTYRATFGPNAPRNHKHHSEYYLIECTGTNHQDANRAADFPKYNSLVGFTVERIRIEH